tara:strand:+ start:190 stop:495 length:306 start_codon:yes stop_codon:yes gene_type:complete
MIGHHTISVTPVEWPYSSPAHADGEHVDDYMARLDAQEGMMYWQAKIVLYGDEESGESTTTRSLRSAMCAPEDRRLALRKMWQLIKKSLQEVPTADILPSP